MDPENGTATSSELPSVSVIVPARNERRHLPEFLATVEAQTLQPLEVVIADGCSEDGTREWLQEAAATRSWLRMVDNPERGIPTALNRAIAAATGDLVARMDTHVRYAPDYLERLVAVLAARPEVVGAGGTLRTEGRGQWGRAIAAVFGRPLGLGAAPHRRGGQSRPVNHIPNGMFRRAALLAVGGYDPSFLVNEDIEADQRLRRAGGVLWLETSVRSTWFMRETPQALARQMWRYGFYRPRTIYLHRSAFNVRHLGPPGLVAGLGGLTVISPRAARLAAMAYLGSVGVWGARAGRLDGASAWRTAVTVPIVHSSYGAGMLTGLVAHAPVLRRARRRGSAAGVDGRPRVLVVARAAPAVDGLASFVELTLANEDLRAQADLELLNTSRLAVRPGGVLSAATLGEAVVDALRTLVKAHRVDVVHVHAAAWPALALARALAICLAARLGGARAFCHIHSYELNHERPEVLNPSRLERFLLSGLSLVDTVFTVAAQGTQTLRRYAPAARLETLDNAVDVRSFTPAPLDHERPTLLFVGSLGRRKGLLDLIEALRLLRERGVTDWDLQIVGGPGGSPEEVEEVRSAAVAAGLASALVGQQRGRALRDRFSAADIFVLPSHQEGQPMAILEAMASGLPIVATVVGAVPDVVRQGVDGLLVEPRDVPALARALEVMISSREVRRRMGRSARSHAEERFDVHRLSTRLSEAYRTPAAR